MDRHWQNTLALMKDRQDPVAGKILTWIYVTETNLPIESHALMAFVRENPGWPRLHDFRRKIEENIDSSGIGPQETADWFRQHPPRTYDGIRAYAGALRALGLEEEAKQALRTFWRDAELDKNETASLASLFKAYLSAQDHAARLDHLIWAGRMREAEYMLAFVDRDTQALGHARIGLATMHGDVDALIAAVPARLQNDEGLLYERARWRRRKNMSDGALDMIRAAATTPAHAGAWWTEKNILARRAMEELDFTKAAALVAAHGLPPGGADHAQAEWLLGWLELRHLGKAAQAYHRFEALYNAVGSAISRSRMAYWAARAAQEAGREDLAAQWDRLGAVYTSTYYGQLSRRRVQGAPAAENMAEGDIPPPLVLAFEKSELVRAVRLLQSVKLEKLADPFLAKLLSQARDKTDYRLAARLAADIGRLYYAVQANKDIQQNAGEFIFTQGYPLMEFPLPGKPERAFIHAIAYRESMFDHTAVSHAGARGLMQLMPATARSMARRRNMRYSKNRLTQDPSYNVKLGAAYLAQLEEQYGGYLPFVIAAYNAGPGNVAKWRRMFGDPSRGEIDIVDWVELVPIYETRNYIQRVMETWYMYRLRLGETPLTVHDIQVPVSAPALPARKPG